MARLSIGLVVVASLYGGAALAESQAEIAARLNEEGKALMFANPPKYAEASAKFQDAHSRVPEPKYFFNHCTSLYQEGRYGEALTACNAADKNADDKLKAKIAKLVERIREEAKKAGVDLQPVGGGGGPGDAPPVTDPNNPNPNPQQTGQPPAQPAYAVGRPPDASLVTSVAPDNKYTWSVGIDFFAGAGSIGRNNYFGKGSAGGHLKADMILMPSQKVGAQVYFQVNHFGEGDSVMPTGYYTLDVLDLGIAAYKHVCGSRSRFCFTPLLGVQLGLMSPADEMDTNGSQVFNYAALGGRGELGFSYAIGNRMEHVITTNIGANVYSRAFTEPANGFTAEDWGLDQGGRSFYISLGYTYRFNTPFGAAPFVTLE